MNTLLPEEYEDLFSALLSLKSSRDTIYLVGGAVRDIYLNKTSHDMDFVVDGSAKRCARRFADSQGGAFYMLDDERETARAICQTDAGETQIFDFAALRAADINADLEKRDFTINAMAMDVADATQLIDPLGGIHHIQQKLLVSCSEQAFVDDPLRVLRGIRLALSLGYRIQPDTLLAMKSASGRLSEISGERVRDELFRMFTERKAHTALRIMERIGVFQTILQDLQLLKGQKQSAPHTLDVWDHSLATIEALETLLKVIVDDEDDNAGGKSLFLGMAMLGLRRFRSEIRDYLEEELSSHRSRRQLLAVAALYHDISKPAAVNSNGNGKFTFYHHEVLGAKIVQRAARNLALSEIEVRFLETVVRHHMRVHQMAKHDELPSKREIHRFFRATGSAGIAICLLSLADTLATYQNTLDQPVWRSELEACMVLMSSWWQEQNQVISPTRLLSGDDLQQEFHLKPGPLIGKLLLELSEAQAAGEVNDRSEALKFVSMWLQSNDN